MDSWMTIPVMVLSAAAAVLAQWSLRSDGSRSPEALKVPPRHIGLID